MTFFFTTRSTALSKTRRRLRASLGYTLIEVMMGLSVLAIGASAILSIQQVTVFGGINQRSIIGATNTAQSWIDRLRVEAMAWHSLTNSDITAANTPFLNAGVTGATAFNWTSPSAAAVGATGAHALDGGEIVPDVAVSGAAFCTHYRLTRLEPNPSGSFRLEVRAFYAKNGRAVDAECAAAPNAVTNMFTAGGTITVNHGNGGTVHSRDEYGIVVLTTVIRRSP